MTIFQDHRKRQVIRESSAESNSVYKVHVDRPAEDCVEEFIVVFHGIFHLCLRANTRKFVRACHV